MSLLHITDLHVIYKGAQHHPVHAVNGVSLTVERGETVGLVGESGCGKSTLGLSVLRLTPIRSGRVLFDSEDVTTLKGVRLLRYRRHAQMIFQDPFGSLNPRLSVGSALDEALKIHHLGDARQRRARVADLLKTVGLDPDFAARYPHEFSGGQRQRIGIARALAVKPSLIIADEPVSALDVSVQAQIMNLLQDLRKENNLAYLLIAHDLAVVRTLCDRVYVMYLGRIMESGTAAQLFESTAHPYTQALLSAVPDVERGLKQRQGGVTRRIVLKGDPPSVMSRIEGCPFHPRCSYAAECCRAGTIAPVEVEPGHISWCQRVPDLMARLKSS